MGTQIEVCAAGIGGNGRLRIFYFDKENPVETIEVPEEKISNEIEVFGMDYVVCCLCENKAINNPCNGKCNIEDIKHRLNVAISSI